MTDPAPGDSARWRVLHDVTDPHAFWSAANLAEAAPGVPSPLGWSLWRQAGELSLRWGFHALGALEREHLAFPTDPGERCVGVFFGRPAIKLDFMCRMGARIPGTGGRAIAEQYLGRVPDELDYPPMRRRWPVILAKMPVLFLRVPGRIRAHASATEAWWRRELRGMDDADLATARETLTLGAQRFVHAVCMAAEAALAGAQPVYDQVARLGDMVGEPELAGKVVTGHGSHVETLMVADLWALSRGEITLATYLDRHGYHGPLEGEVSAHVWREEARPLEELARR